MSLVDEIKEIPSSKKDLRKFGLTLGVFFALLGLLFWWQGRPYFRVVFILSVIFLFFGLALPALLKPIQKIWMTLALLMGWVMTRAILGLLFYLVITPLGFIIRLSDKDLLNLKSKDQATYWLDHAPRDKSSYENQF